jgi:SAM-dependent methyltransferase
MKKLMHNIKWDSVNCHICESSEKEQIKINNEPLVDGQFGFSVHPVICKNCGLVFLGKRWSKEFYGIFYENYYDDLYRLETKPEYGISAVINNMDVIWNRIKPHVIDVNEKLNILDLGSSYGHGLKHLQSKLPNSNIFAIESSPESIEVLQSSEIGATLITNDFDLDWENKYKDSMDIIVMRHVFEHVLDPLLTLKKIRKALKKDGILYIAVPDIVNIRTNLRDYDNWWEYIFRSVHTYYYSKDTFIKTLQIESLYPVEIQEEEEEIWAVIKKDTTNNFDFENQYNKQKQIFEKYFNL